MSSTCSHLEEIQFAETSINVCEECIAMGDHWVHLRMCMICGHVGCCDQSKNKHATQHFHTSEHPLVRSVERGESWVWCYVDKVFMDDVIRG